MELLYELLKKTLEGKKISTAVKIKKLKILEASKERMKLQSIWNLETLELIEVNRKLADLEERYSLYSRALSIFLEEFKVGLNDNAFFKILKEKISSWNDAEKFGEGLNDSLHTFFKNSH
ncbi:hypothetical protein SteCoe_39366 [Stentor coeruleus]|uniref:Uncharacterized protein n=1 Tax=Stentor coeruleus TaxID=5963 RepID=A0A1R2AKS5_9CILI|nr:hypothetical protein SteCoe_39366 [Stentor coeruleus]